MNADAVLSFVASTVTIMGALGFTVRYIGKMMTRKIDSAIEQSPVITEIRDKLAALETRIK